MGYLMAYLIAAVTVGAAILGIILLAKWNSQ